MFCLWRSILDHFWLVMALNCVVIRVIIVLLDLPITHSIQHLLRWYGILRASGLASSFRFASGCLHFAELLGVSSLALT